MKSQTALLPLIDLVFLALGAVLACMTQMDIVRALPVEVSRVGKGSAIVENTELSILAVGEDGMSLDGVPVTAEELLSDTPTGKIVLRADRNLPTEKTVAILAILAEAGANVSIEVDETDIENAG